MSKNAKTIGALLLLALLLASAALFFLQQRQNAPALTRALPPAEGYFYLDLRPVRLALQAKSAALPKIQRDEEYDSFVRATGFEFERDLDQAAIAIHNMEPTPGAGGRIEMQRRYSEFFSGHFDRAKLTAWFDSHSSQHDSYNGKTIYTIPFEGRTIRVVILAEDLVAVSNVNDAGIIRSMVDGSERAAWMQKGPELLRTHYQDVPLGSLAWLVADFRSPDGQSSTLPLPSDTALNLPAGTVCVLSAGPSGFAASALSVRVQAVTVNEQDAKSLANSVKTFAEIFRAMASNAKEQDADVRAFYESLHVAQDGSRVIIEAEISSGFLKKSLTPEAPAAAPLIEGKKPAAKVSTPEQVKKNIQDQVKGK